MKRFFPVLLLIVLSMILAPSAKADGSCSPEGCGLPPAFFNVTSGFISIYGHDGNNNVSFSGPGFTFNGGASYLPACPNYYAPGQPIQGCGNPDIQLLVSAGGTLIVDGVTHGFGASYVGTDFFQAPMFLSGATQATLTEPSTGGGFTGCADNVAPCGGSFPGQQVSFNVVGDESFSISLTQDLMKGGYDVTNEIYTITAPEPGSGVLLLFGLGLFGLVIRKQYCPQCSKRGFVITCTTGLTFKRLTQIN